ncbi:PREDICTED: pentatricopeptide repeat-containing protein At2g29760, chloroplastic-like [Tarenaya hassleriana]|uniref:pentatricopeptide repeat-containing protein At2g29760, chloroplastic-like n=1 Tax=Tarenaya hassleriana TaxID=28532 RepID=UPI00053CA1AD|nr:PREDICTED: pentatricopeptide repeat-containing protein At2g29760, chloroplastic-like [Tarenaya hassleriana]
MKIVSYSSRRFASLRTNSTLDRRTFLKSTSIDAAKELHAHLIRTHLHTDPYSISSVIKAYALSPSHFSKARIAFDQTKRPTLLIWNYMIRGLSLGDRPDEAVRMYRLLCRRGLVGDNLTFIFVLKACSRVSGTVLGEEIHGRALKLGFESYLFVSNALIHMYGLCGCANIARKVFDGMLERDLVSWNSMICAYSQCDMYDEVLVLFESMRDADVEPDAVTLVKVLLACGHLGKQETADSVMKYIEKSQIEIDVYLGNTLIDMYGRRAELARKILDSMKETNTVSWNAMINGYAKTGNLEGARKLFDQMPRRDVISWTSIITGYCQTGHFADAVKLFQEMVKAKVKPDEITVASVLPACAHLGSLDTGQAIHKYIRTHDLKLDIYVGNALIDMYCKCGDVGKAMAVFDEMKEKDLVSWNSIISGLAVNGFASSAFDLFYRMFDENVKPNSGTFVGIFLACTHAGLVDKGLEFFEGMKSIHGVNPGMKHYGCIVDLLGRSGHLDKAYDFINAMPEEPDVVLWRILLSACKLHGNIHLAEVVMKKLSESDPSNSGNYLLFSNVYASSNRWDDATNARETMAKFNVKKPTGLSSIEGETP